MDLAVYTRPADFDLWEWEVVHEFGHVLGFEHEHQRKDRELFLLDNLPIPANKSRGRLSQLRLLRTRGLRGCQAESGD